MRSFAGCPAHLLLQVNWSDRSGGNMPINVSIILIG
jgi:hypothetical protein